jgi:hypothetical protein
MIKKYTLFLLAIVAVQMRAMEPGVQKLKGGAGIFPYARNPYDDQYYFLLSEEVLGDIWCDCGGRVDKEVDTSNFDIAVREFAEESGYFSAVRKDQDSMDALKIRLINAPYVETTYYIMYIAQIVYLEKGKFEDKQEEKEKKDYRWIPVKKFIQLIDTMVYQKDFKGIGADTVHSTLDENPEIGKITYEGKPYALRPEFLISLRGMLKEYDLDRDAEYFDEKIQIPRLILWLQNGNDPGSLPEGYGQLAPAVKPETLPNQQAQSLAVDLPTSNVSKSPGDRKAPWVSNHIPGTPTTQFKPPISIENIKQPAYRSNNPEPQGWIAWICRSVIDWLWSCLPSWS